MVILIVATYIAAMEIRLQLSIKKALSILSGLRTGVPFLQAPTITVNDIHTKKDIFKLQDIVNLGF